MKFSKEAFKIALQNLEARYSNAIAPEVVTWVDDLMTSAILGLDGIIPPRSTHFFTMGIETGVEYQKALERIEELAKMDSQFGNVKKA